jgi:hypothetical protein
MAPFQKLKEKLKELENNKAGKLAGKIGSFFDPEPQKEKVLRHEDFSAAGDVYYADVAVAYKIISRILWLFFVFFLVFSIITNHRDITYENFYYLFKDFSSAVDAGTSNYETLSYDSDSRQKFALYRGGLATVNPSTLSIYTATGRKTIRENINYSSPHIVCSDKYVLVYDSSGKSFSVYNSFSRIFSDTLEYPITDACFASNGRFAIVTRDADSKAVVYIYGKNFKKLAKYGYDEYAFDVAISSERNLLMMLFYGEGDGVGRTELALCNADDLKDVGAWCFEGEFPIGAFFIDRDRIALITDRAVRIFDEKMTEIESVEYIDSEIVDFCVTDDGFAVSTLKNAKNQLIVFDKNGKLVYNSYIKYNVMQIGFSEDFAFVNTGDGVARISLKNGKDEFLPSDNGKLLVYSETTALICGEARAEYLVFGRN